MTSSAAEAKSTRSRTKRALAAAILATLAAAMVQAASATANSAAVTSTTGSPHLDDDVDALVAAGAPGAILVIRDGNRTVRIASGLGNVSTRTAMRPSDRFR